MRRRTAPAVRRRHIGHSTTHCCRSEQRRRCDRFQGTAAVGSSSPPAINRRDAKRFIRPTRIGTSILLSSFDFLSHTFDFKPFGFLCSPWWRSVLGGFGGGMNTCFGSKLVGSAFVQLP